MELPPEPTHYELPIGRSIQFQRVYIVPHSNESIFCGSRAHARLNFRQIEETHLMENIIFNELKKRGFAVDIGLIEIRETSDDGKRLRKQLEVDFIAYKGNNKYYLQSVFSLPDGDKKRQKERPLLNIDDSFKKIIVVGNHIKLKRDENGITTMGIREFLLKENSLDL